MSAQHLSGSWSTPLASDSASDVANSVSGGWRPINFESLIALSRYDKGQLVEVRLYPTDGRFDGPVSDLGIPRSAAPALAQRILSRVQALSKSFGTSIALEGSVGVIRVAQQTPTTAGSRQQ